MKISNISRKLALSLSSLLRILIASYTCLVALPPPGCFLCCQGRHWDTLLASLRNEQATHANPGRLLDALTAEEMPDCGQQIASLLQPQEEAIPPRLC